MLVLLPPSETKRTPPPRGARLNLPGLSFPDLNPVREQVLDALITTSAAANAGARLGTGASLAAEVERNLRLRELPTQPVSSLYTGVLYDALDWATLDARGRRRANASLVVFSGLWGALRPGDRVPSYRMSMSADVGLGPMAARWRDVLNPCLSEAAGNGAIVDLRSSTYAAAWKPAGALAERTVGVRVLRELNGKRTVVSHMAKHTRGLLARELLLAPGTPKTVDQVAQIAANRWPIELTRPPRVGQPWLLDVVIPG